MELGFPGFSWGLKMLFRMFDAVFGCWHSHYSFPMTVRAGSQRSGAAAGTGTYVVCLDCGKEFSYDWQAMKLVEPQRQESARSLVTKEAA
ncbi:MAG TPA: hypothetical protein VEK84_11570 [Terriglobales bacterium]|nr:hypothetical protein [Terriglobales bacterium]